LKESEDHNPFDEDEPDKEMDDNFEDLEDIFNDIDRQDDDDFGDASIHPLTLKGGEENPM